MKFMSLYPILSMCLPKMYIVSVEITMRMIVCLFEEQTIP